MSDSGCACSYGGCGCGCLLIGVLLGVILVLWLGS